MSLEDELIEYMDDINDLDEQARMFDLQVDWETGSLIKVHLPSKPEWLERWQERNQDKQWSHEVMMKDGAE